MHNIEGIRNALPPSNIDSPTVLPNPQLYEFLRDGTTGTTGTDYARTGVWAIILPYLEQGNVLLKGSGYDYKKHWYDVQNIQAASTRIPVFECPSSPGPRFYPGTSSGVQGSSFLAAGLFPGLTDYAVIRRGPNTSSLWTTGIGVTYPGTDGINGVLTANQYTKLASIQDGLSNTMLAGEISARPQQYVFGNPTGTPTGLGFPRGAWGGYESAWVAIEIQGTNTAGNNISAASQVATGCRLNCTNDSELFSFHTGGLNVVMGDGSVRYLSESISMRTLYCLAARNDGQPISE
jgi:prepilin-type processing-associated H-X9-DG protein